MKSHPIPTPRAFSLAGVVVACLIVPACSPDGEPRVPVYPTSGKVTYLGQPLAGALVVFRRADADAKSKVPSPVATTGADGMFKLRTYEPDDGAPAGDYLVTIAMAPPLHDEGGGILAEKREKRAVDPLKARFADPRTSGLKATIKPVENTIDTFDLKETGGAPSPGDGRGSGTPSRPDR